MEPIYFQSKGADEFRFLSNFYPAPITVSAYFAGKPYNERRKVTTWTTSEHLYQSMKCAKHEDMERVRLAPTPGEAKKLGAQVELNPDWDLPCVYHTAHVTKVCVMIDAVRLKFRQNPDLAQKLLDTGSRELIEYAPWGDTYWGVDKNLKGNNMLGRILMQVRNELRNP